MGLMKDLSQGYRERDMIVFNAECPVTGIRHCWEIKGGSAGGSKSLAELTLQCNDCGRMSVASARALRHYPGWPIPENPEEAPLDEDDLLPGEF